MSEHKIIKNSSENLIICFGGMALKMGGILPFEFLNYLSKTFQKNTDLYFYIDKKQCWYHKGIDGITENIEDTVLYLNNIIKKSNYKKILFMGVSAGGYASILFGSLCNVSSVIAFVPRTKLINPINKKYGDLKLIVNNQTDSFERTKVTDLLLEEEYFEAAKQILDRVGISKTERILFDASHS